MASASVDAARRAARSVAAMITLTGAAISGAALTPVAVAAAQPIEVALQKTDDGWQLLRDGKPYVIHGAGGSGSMTQLAAAGANSVRTWSTENAQDVLDEAHALGLTVTLGLWLGHERHGFDYNDPEQVSKQLATARDAVLQYKDHPALLLWGVGNEAEGFDAGDNPKIWAAINDVAAMIKATDPLHPTMTVTAEIGGERIAFLHERSPAVDIHGINSYGGATSLVERYRKAGATKPFVLTEFGPTGTWEAATTPWGAPIEPTSTQKARQYTQHHTATVGAAPDLALGAYAFLWGNKMEGTATWFGMLLPDGTQVGAADAMSILWSGRPPAHLAPVIEPLTLRGDAEVKPGKTRRVDVALSDPAGGPLTTRWALFPESNDYVTGGDFRATPPEIEDAIVRGDHTHAEVKMPREPGAYRLFVEARNANGKAATANLPLKVIGTPRTRLPVYVYREGLEGMPWAPSGWMGSTEGLTLDGEDTEFPFKGKYSLRLSFSGNHPWVAVAWQNPPNNWGDQDGGFDLTGARYLELMARGRFGAERVKFGVGLLGKEKPHPDSGITSTDDITLTSEWERYRIPLRGLDLTSLKTGFVLSIYGRPSTVTLYLDNIRFVR